VRALGFFAAIMAAVALIATCEYGIPIAGSMLFKYRLLSGSINWPSIKFWIWDDSAGAASRV